MMMAGGVAAILFLLLLAVLAAFVGVIAFTSDDDDDGQLKQEVLTSASSIVLGYTSFGDCQNDVDITNWRLQRTGKLVTFTLIGSCVNTTSTGSIDIDFNFSQFPNPYKTPSITETITDVGGTGSALADSGESAYVNVEGDTNEECIDLDMEFPSTLAGGSNVDFSFICHYELD